MTHGLAFNSEFANVCELDEDFVHLSGEEIVLHRIHRERLNTRHRKVLVDEELDACVVRGF